jgi:hypothetical protein
VERRGRIRCAEAAADAAPLAAAACGALAAAGVARAVAWGGTGDGGGTGEGAPDCGCDVGVASSRISRTARTPRLVTVEIAPCVAKESQVQ